MTNYTYDDLDRPTNVQQPDGNSISYGYDPNGNRTQITTPAGTVQYAYDALNRVDAVTDFIADPIGATTTLTYTPLGLMDTISRPNGVTTDYGYDARHRLTNITHGSFATGDPHTFSYSYDLANNATQLVETRNGGTITTNWQYDDAYRLLTETTDRSGASMTTAFAYDAMGNRLSQTSGGVTTNYTYNELDQLITANNGQEIDLEYVYDDRGNRIQEINHDDFTSQLFYYDAQDRMIQTTSTAGTSTYTYDYMGNRVQQNQGGNVTNYLWDEGSRFKDVVYEYDNLGDAINSYTLVNDMILAQTNTAETLYLLPDRLGSTRAVVNESGNVTDTFDYDAFGKLTGNNSNLSTNYLFAGQQYNSSTDLYSMRARYYDPSMGRFLSQDTYPYNFQNPIELNRYGYTANNPINWTDPSGLNLIQRVFSHRYVMIARQGLRAFVQDSFVQGFAGGGAGYIFAEWILFSLAEVDGDMNRIDEVFFTPEITSRIPALFSTFDFWLNSVLGGFIGIAGNARLDVFIALFSANTASAIITNGIEFITKLVTLQLRGTSNFAAGIAEQTMETVHDFLIGLVGVGVGSVFVPSIELLTKGPVKAFLTVFINTIGVSVSLDRDRNYTPPCERTTC